MSRIAYGTCVGSWDKLRRNVIPRIGDAPLIAMSGQTSIAVAYNTILDAYTSRNLDAVILLHDDLDMIDPDAEAKFLAALTSPGVALVGVCGGKGDKTLAWWDSETVGHQMTDSGMLDFGERTGDVALIEGSIMVFSPWAIANLRFDPVPGFHSYDEIAMQARQAGKRVVVADVDTHHHTKLGFKSAASREQWQRGDGAFRAKWNSLRVNLGCGDRYADGWSNVDNAAMPYRKDGVVDLAGPLPWQPGSIGYAYAGHVLEHMTPAEAASLLQRLMPLMAPGGQLMVVGPDVAKAEAMIAAGTFDYGGGHTLDLLRHGGHRWPGDEHRWECTGPKLADMLKQAGWVDVTELEIGDVPDIWPVADRGPLWQCALRAVAP